MGRLACACPMLGGVADGYWPGTARKCHSGSPAMAYADFIRPEFECKEISAS